MKNISELNDCYGCGVCVRVCPVNIISLRENADGFYSPVIDENDKCISCGLCLKACAFNHTEVAEPSGRLERPGCYAAWSLDGNVREWCSSGGVGYELGRRLIEKGYKAVGVRYDAAKGRAEHFVAWTAGEYAPSVGSKYLPSFTADAFSSINPDERYLITGTPCQIDSLRRMLRHYRREDNFVLLDFFCHGVPSKLAWDKYIALVAERLGAAPGFVSWRNKALGWQNPYSINADPESKSPGYDIDAPEPCHAYASPMTRGDFFYRLFLGEYCLNKCCYETCKYKMMSSAADIRVGDLWGGKYAADSKGVSAVICLTERGAAAVSELAGAVELRPESEEVVTGGQMRVNAHMPGIYKKLMDQLRSPLPLPYIINHTLRLYNLRFLHYRVANRLLKLLGLPPINYAR